MMVMMSSVSILKQYRVLESTDTQATLPGFKSHLAKLLAHVFFKYRFSLILPPLTHQLKGD